MSRYLRIPRPKRFLGFFDLQNGAEIVMMSTALNKISGIFGIFAIFTGADINATQLSMYFYSLAAFVLICVLAPHIHKRRPLAAISFAYFYLLDSIVNALYTCWFGVSWFLVLTSSAQAARQASGSPTEATPVAPAPAATSPSSIVARIVNASLDAASVPVASKDSTGAAGVLAPESATSIFIISLLWAIRVYFVLIIFSFAREVVRASATPVEAPFEGSNNGQGWQGVLGRTLVGLGRGYWEGKGWMKFSKKFRRSTEPEDRRRFRGMRLDVEV